MKNNHFLLSAAILCAATGFAAPPRVVQNPIINYANTATLDITSVELTDTATILHVNAYYFPHQWIRIASETYLKADGNTYPITGSKGIALDQEFFMPDSGETDFTLFFKPIPQSTSSFDFIEGDFPGSFKFWDIDLSGTPFNPTPKGLPDYLTRIDTSGAIPPPEFTISDTDLTIHLLGYRPDLGASLKLYINAIDGSQKEIPLPKPDKDGDISATIPLVGTASAFIHGGGLLSSSPFWLQPGEVADLYIDLRSTGAFAMHHRDNAPNVVRAYLDGHYSALTKAAQENASADCVMQLYDGTFADYKMTGDQYFDMVCDKYNALSAAIDTMNFSPMAKEYRKLFLQGQFLEAIGQYKYFLTHNYRHVKDSWNIEVPFDSIPGELTPEHFARATKIVDVNNPSLLLTDARFSHIDWNSYGAPGELSKSLTIYRNKMDKALKGNLTDDDIAELQTLSNPFFAEACKAEAARQAKAMSSLAESGLISKNPDVPAEQFIDAITAPHKGKVVIIDLWNTWCGPCRGALELNEPYKSTELADPDIVFIYVADTSSSPEIYLDLIKGIKGEHYLLDSDYMNIIRNQFNVDGIPYYILVGRDGKAAGRPDIRDHNLYIKEIKSALGAR